MPAINRKRFSALHSPPATTARRYRAEGRSVFAIENGFERIVIPQASSEATAKRLANQLNSATEETRA